MVQLQFQEQLIALRDNLIRQRQIMLADDVPALLELTSGLQELMNSLDLEKLVASLRAGEVSEEEVNIIKEIMELLETNKLLAKQSLSFARRMLAAINGGNGQVAPGLGLDRKV